MSLVVCPISRELQVPAMLVPVCINHIYDLARLLMSCDMIYVACLILWILWSATYNRYITGYIQEDGICKFLLLFPSVCVEYESDSVLLVYNFDTFHAGRSHNLKYECNTWQHIFLRIDLYGRMLQMRSVHFRINQQMYALSTSELAFWLFQLICASAFLKYDSF